MQTRLKKKFFLTLLGVSILPVAAYCQVDTAWVRRYNGSGNKVDEILSFAVDDSGNAVITGCSGNYSSNWDFVTIKYDRNGNQLWLQSYTGVQYNQNTPNSLTLDKGSNVYVTGARGITCATVKYDPNGNQLWEAQYPNGAAFGSAVATDEKSNAYVAGISGYSYTEFDYLTLKYDSNGNQRWAAVFNKGQNYSDHSYLIAPGKNGSVYVSGYSYNAALGKEQEWITIKYDSLGNQVWMKPFSTWQGATVGAPADMKLDAMGNLYLTGGFQDSGIFVSYATIKYDTAGNQQWVARYRGPLPSGAYDFAIALALDDNANVYITGSSYENGPTDADIVTIKHDSSGNQLWLRRYKGPANGYDEGRSIAVDSIGNVYVAGQSMGVNSAYDYVVLKYDSSGNFLWEKRYEGPVFNRATEKLFVNQNGNVYLAGTDSKNAHDFVTIKYSPLPQIKGDLNLDGVLTLADIVLAINCVFWGEATPAPPSACDFNCDGQLTPADVILILNLYYLGSPPPC